MSDINGWTVSTSFALASLCSLALSLVVHVSHALIVRSHAGRGSSSSPSSKGSVHGSSPMGLPRTTALPFYISFWWRLTHLVNPVALRSPAEKAQRSKLARVVDQVLFAIYSAPAILGFSCPVASSIFGSLYYSLSMEATGSVMFFASIFSFIIQISGVVIFVVAVLWSNKKAQNTFELFYVTLPTVDATIFMRIRRYWIGLSIVTLCSPFCTTWHIFNPDPDHIVMSSEGFSSHPPAEVFTSMASFIGVLYSQIHITNLLVVFSMSGVHVGAYACVLRGHLLSCLTERYGATSQKSTGKINAQQHQQHQQQQQRSHSQQQHLSPSALALSLTRVLVLVLSLANAIRSLSRYLSVLIIPAVMFGVFVGFLLVTFLSIKYAVAASTILLILCLQAVIVLGALAISAAANRELESLHRLLSQAKCVHALSNVSQSAAVSSKKTEEPPTVVDAVKMLCEAVSDKYGLPEHVSSALSNGGVSDRRFVATGLEENRWVSLTKMWQDGPPRISSWGTAVQVSPSPSATAGSSLSWMDPLDVAALSESVRAVRIAKLSFTVAGVTLTYGTVADAAYLFGTGLLLIITTFGAGSGVSLLGI
eukprot:ANDGO_08326.mRNA.1 hypothetical protein